MERRILLALLALGALVDGFFALVNFYPVAPPHSRGPRRLVVAAMDPVQAAWVQHHLIDEFNREESTSIELHAVDEAELETATRGAGVILSQLPVDRAQGLADRGGTEPFDGEIPSHRIATDYAPVRAELLRAATYRGRQYFLPRTVVLDVAMYRATRVRDAMLHWHAVENEINAALRSANGRGLPAGYALEPHPSQWDSYDEFVLGFYWAHRSYAGAPARGRIAHRTGTEAESQMELLGGMIRAGAGATTLAHRDTVPSADYFQWESLRAQYGLYAEEMFEPDGLNDEGVIDGVVRGEFFFTDVDQMEAFTIHGGAHRDAPSHVANGDDLDFAAMPRFASLELDAHGHPARTAETFSFREDSVWVLPAGGTDRKLAYRFATWLLSRENHARECTALGMLPIREDVIRERETLFRAPWMLEVFDAALAQWPRSEIASPSLSEGPGLDASLTWTRVISARGLATDRNALMQILRAPVVRPSATGDHDGGAGEREDEDRAEGAGEEDNHGEGFNVPPLREPVVIQFHDAGVEGGTTSEVRQ